MKLSVKSISGKNIRPYLNDLADLRIKVFREFPYLYEGNIDYEMNYLQTYVNSERSLIVLVRDERDLVGASTCVPIVDEWADFKTPLLNAGYDLSKIFYFGESIVLPAYRGKKLGHRFFELREHHAWKTIPDLEITTFCAVNRPADHPLRPSSYQSLDSFWSRMGYRKQSDLVAKTLWKDIDQPREDSKSLTFWTKMWR